jgi:ankyrin repeat protein
MLGSSDIIQPIKELLASNNTDAIIAGVEVLHILSAKTSDYNPELFKEVYIRVTALLAGIQEKLPGYQKYKIDEIKDRYEAALRRNVTAQQVPDNGEAPIHIAAKTGDIALLNQLIAQGVNPNLPDRYGVTPLHIATAKGHKDFIDALLLQPGIEVNTQNHSQLTALHIAIANKYQEIANALLAHPRIDVNSRDYDGDTALILAKAYGCAEVANILLACPETEFNDSDDYGKVLILAIKRGFHDLTQELLARPGINVNVKNSHGDTALSCAAERARKDVVIALLANGAQPTPTIVYRKAPIWCMIKLDDIKDMLANPDAKIKLHPSFIKEIIEQAMKTPNSNAITELAKRVQAAQEGRVIV